MTCVRHSSVVAAFAFIVALFAANAARAGVGFADPSDFNPSWESANPGSSYDNTLPTAALLGNGSLGAVNGGDAGRKLFVLTRSDLWSCGDLTCGTQANNIGPMSFADFELLPGSNTVGSTDVLDLRTATLSTAGAFGKGNVRLESYVAAGEDLFIVSGVSSADDVWALRLSAHGEKAAFPHEAKVLDGGFYVRRSTLNLLPKGDPRGWVTNATAAVVAVGAKIAGARAIGDSTVEAKAEIRAGVPFAFVVSHGLARRFTRRELEKVRAHHVAWWREWWGRSRIAIGDAELERFYFGQVYLLGSCARKGKFPPGLYGLWQTTDYPKWRNDFHMNYNYVATFYGCFAANRCEVAETMPDPLIDYLPQAVRNAKENLRFIDRYSSVFFKSGKLVSYPPIRKYLDRRADLADGIDDAALFPVGLGPWGVSPEGDRSQLGQISDGVFNCAVACTHWEYTLDRDYLKKVWPLLDKTANFFLAWCEREEREDGGYWYVVWDSIHESKGFGKNSVPALACARHLFRTLVAATPTLRESGIDVPAAKLSAWMNFAEHLAPLPVGSCRIGDKDVPILCGIEGQTSIPDSTARNAVHLESVIPGEAFSFDVTDEFRALATNAVNACIVQSPDRVWTCPNQTPKLFATAIRAGYPPEPIIEAFKKGQLGRYGQKNFTLHDGVHGVEKIGAMEFIQSMLIQCDNGFVKVFPNWTGADAKFENLRAKGCFLLSAEMANGEVVRVEVKSEKGGTLRLVDPWGGMGRTCAGWRRGKTRNSGETTLEREFKPGESAILATKESGVLAFEAARPVWPAGMERQMNTFVEFLAAFEAKSGEEAVLRITGSSVYKARLNGEVVGYGPARAGGGFFRVDEWPLRTSNGVNRLSVEVSAYNCNTYCQTQWPGFLQAEVVAGGRVLSATGRDFTAHGTSRIVKCSRYGYQRAFGEAYRLSEDRAAQPLVLAVQPSVSLVERIAPLPDLGISELPAPFDLTKVVWRECEKYRPVRFIDRHEPTFKLYEASDLDVNIWRELQNFDVQRVGKAAADGKGGIVLADGSGAMFDAGLNRTGFPGATVVCRKAGRLWMAFDEILHQGGIDPLRGQTANGIVWEMQPGRHEIESFEPYTFRYLHVFAQGGEFEVSGEYVRNFRNPDAGRARFRSSDPAIDRIFAAARETFAQNAVDVFTDCPGRERAGWLCDSFFTGRTAHLLTGRTDLERLFLQNYILPKSFPGLPDGALPMCYPADHPNGNFIPNWMMWLVLEADEYLLRSGDRGTVDALKPRLAKAVEYLWRFRNGDGLLERLPAWVFVEWSKANSLVRDVNYPSNMLWARMLECMDRLYGMQEMAAEAERVRETVRRQSWTGEWFCDNALRQPDGTLKLSGECTETCQYYAFMFKTATPETHPGLWNVLLTDFGPARGKTKKHREIHFSNAFIGNYLRLELLSRAGRDRQVLAETKGFFDHMAKRTGTLWEHTGATASCNHGFASHVAVLYVMNVLGIEKIDPASKTVAVRATDVPLSFCEATLPVPGGELTYGWRRENGGIERTFSAPVGWTLKEPERKILIHSHNDYAQERPFWGAYEAGADSIEADVFLVGGDLLVAHSRKELKAENTLRRLYLEPLREVVRRNGGQVRPDGRPLQLLVDLKTGKAALDRLVAIIEKEGFRDCFDIGKNQSAVQLTISGDHSKVADFLAYPDYVFFDVPSERTLADGQFARVPLMSDYARRYTRWKRGAMEEADKDRIRAAVEAAHKRGCRFRLWGIADSQAAWRLSMELGIDYINTDHPDKVAAFLKRNAAAASSGAQEAR